MLFFLSIKRKIDIQYVYTKTRHQLGQPINFNDQPAEILAEIVPNLNLLHEFIYRNPVEIVVQNSIQLSEHEMNTIRYQMETKDESYRRWLGERCESS